MPSPSAVSDNTALPQERFIDLLQENRNAPPSTYSPPTVHCHRRTRRYRNAPPPPSSARTAASPSPIAVSVNTAFFRKVLIDLLQAKSQSANNIFITNSTLPSPIAKGVQRASTTTVITNCG